jgi:hypothetical protein
VGKEAALNGPRAGRSADQDRVVQVQRVNRRLEVIRPRAGCSLDMAIIVLSDGKRRQRIALPIDGADHHSLKARAIREQKIHIVGSPELKIEGTPVYLDVEGLPDRDFYYLIGVLIGNGESAVQHSLWADTVQEEGKIWMQFLGKSVTPNLIEYSPPSPRPIWI